MQPSLAPPEKPQLRRTPTPPPRRAHNNRASAHGAVAPRTPGAGGDGGGGARPHDAGSAKRPCRAVGAQRHAARRFLWEMARRRPRAAGAPADGRARPARRARAAHARGVRAVGGGGGRDRPTCRPRTAGGDGVSRSRQRARRQGAAQEDAAATSAAAARRGRRAARAAAAASAPPRRRGRPSRRPRSTTRSWRTSRRSTSSSRLQRATRAHATARWASDRSLLCREQAGKRARGPAHGMAQPPSLSTVHCAESPTDGWREQCTACTPQGIMAAL